MKKFPVKRKKGETEFYADEFWAATLIFRIMTQYLERRRQRHKLDKKKRTSGKIKKKETNKEREEEVAKRLNSRNDLFLAKGNNKRKSKYLKQPELRKNFNLLFLIKRKYQHTLIGYSCFRGKFREYMVERGES